MRLGLRTRQLVIAVSILGIVSACGSDDGGDSSSTEAAAAGSSAPATTSGSAEASATTAAGAAETTAAGGGAASGGALTISGFAFDPKELTVPAGTVDITNDDGATHSVTADDDSFNVDVSGGGSASITVDTPGTYSYHCRFHSSMTGTIIVT